MLNTMKETIICYYVTYHEKKFNIFQLQVNYFFCISKKYASSKICQSKEVEEVNFQSFDFHKVFRVSWEKEKMGEILESY